MNPEPLRSLYLRGVCRLKGVPRPEIEAKVLLLHAARIAEEIFHAHPELRPPARAAEAYERLIRRRLAGVPLGYLTGRKEFWSLAFRVGPGVLIPRPETELVVETAIELTPGGSAALLDMGTGSGNIAIALARELPGARVTAADVSIRALRIAQANALANGCGGIRFVRSDLFSALGRPRPRFDIIVSNPPYIGREEWAGLPAEVKDHEPRRALVGGVSGTELTANLVRGARPFLRRGGHLVLEIGSGHEPLVRAMFGAGWGGVRVVPDLAGIPRVVVARKAEKARGGPRTGSPACGTP